MSKQCDICQKKSLKAKKLSFSHKHHTYRQEPNLQLMKVNINGTVKKIKICTSCIKANKVQRAV
jgi:large subunit ribosomal protein L28